MKIVQHSFGADLDWTATYAEQLGGEIVGNFIVVPEEIHTGVRYIADCGEDAIVLYINVKYNTDLQFVQKNLKDDFIGFYYDLTENKIENANHIFQGIERFGYNLSIIDGAFERTYNVKKGSSTFIICVFIKKLKIKQYAKKNIAFHENIDKIMDANKNVFIKFDRISLKSNLVLKELQNDLVTDSTFNLRLIASVHLLVSDYLSQMINDTIVIEKVNYKDLMSIIAIQNFLFENVEDFFPSIGGLAAKAHMSETKFKKLFLKITGITPNAFFMNTKFFRAKELLLEKNYSIAEVAEKLNFGSYSYFISTFKKHYGVSPLTLLKKHN